MYNVMCICLCRNFPDHNKEHVNNFHFTESILCYIGKLNTQNLGWYCMLPNVFQQIRKSWNIFKLAWSIRFMEQISSCLTYLLLMMRLMNGANLWEIKFVFWHWHCIVSPRGSPRGVRADIWHCSPHPCTPHYSSRSAAPLQCQMVTLILSRYTSSITFDGLRRRLNLDKI